MCFIKEIAKKKQQPLFVMLIGVMNIYQKCLKYLRKTISQKENLPPFVIFQDPSLEDMCIQYPTTIDEMTNISGVGTGKAQKYGKPFADLIKKYVDDNETEEYSIVGSTEADPFENKISNESPIAKAILGKKAGETVSVESPNGSYDVKIISIK